MPSTPSVKTIRFTGRSSGTDGVTGSDLLTGTGDLTAVGKVFVEKYASLQRCIADDRPSPVHVSEPAYPAPSEEPPAHLTPEATSKPTERPSPSEGSEGFRNAYRHDLDSRDMQQGRVVEVA